MIRTIGVILVVLGVVALAYGGISYTTRDEVADIGPVTITKENRETIPLPPLLGGVSLAGGLGLLLFGRRG